jgi:hypothetical protein
MARVAAAMAAGNTGVVALESRYRVLGMAESVKKPEGKNVPNFTKKPNNIEFHSPKINTNRTTC